MKSLDTERLHLRPFTDDDIEIHRVVFSDPEVCRFYCGKTRTEEESREWLIHRRWQAKNADELGFHAVVRKADGQILGLVALQLCVADWLRYESDPHAPCHPLVIELSYAFGQEFHGQGYAGESCRALIRWGFEEVKLPKLTNGLSPENIPSNHLCERLGFRRIPNVHPDGDGFGCVWELSNPALGG